MSTESVSYDTMLQTCQSGGLTESTGVLEATLREGGNSSGQFAALTKTDTDKPSWPLNDSISVSPTTPGLYRAKQEEC
jgi:hypothetical protein